MDDRYLAIYLNDQLALGTGWRELARRAASGAEAPEARAALELVATGVAEDVETFESIMERLGIARDRVKPLLATAGERFGRLKPNGHLRTPSPLSPFVELDALAMGIDGKRLLWENLRDLAGLGDRLADVDFDELIARAQAQRDELEPFRAQAGRTAFLRSAPA
jgi:hypothetical protein